MFFGGMGKGFLIAPTGAFLSGGCPSFPALAQGELVPKVKTKVPHSLTSSGTADEYSRYGKGVVFVVSPQRQSERFKAVGGNPILVNSAVDALKRWKFEPAPDETFRRTGVSL